MNVEEREVQLQAVYARVKAYQAKFEEADREAEALTGLLKTGKRKPKYDVDAVAKYKDALVRAATALANLEEATDEMKALINAAEDDTDEENLPPQGWLVGKAKQRIVSEKTKTNQDKGGVQ